MTRKDSEKDAERPHYYSQFWLDVAAGRKVIGAPKPEEGADLSEAETPEPTPLRKAGRGSVAPITDGYKEMRTQPVVEPEYGLEEFAEPEEEEIELANEVDDLDLPNIVVDDTLEDTSISDLDNLPEEEEEPEIEEEEDFLFEDEEEDEDEDSWSARGRKKPKPGRQLKQPKQPKKPRRDSHRGF